MSDFHVFIRDVLQHVDTVQKDYPELPVFLLGHSMVSRPQKTQSNLALRWVGGVRTHDGKGAAVPPCLSHSPLLADMPHSERPALGVPGNSCLGNGPGSASWGQPQRELRVAHSFLSGGGPPVLTGELKCGASWETDLFLNPVSISMPFHREALKGTSAPYRATSQSRDGDLVSEKCTECAKALGACSRAVQHKRS